MNARRRFRTCWGLIGILGISLLVPPARAAGPGNRLDEQRAEASRLAALLVARLDEGQDVEQRFNDQKVATAKARAAALNTKTILEIAEIARQEYLNGTFPQDVQTARGEIALAESELERAKDRAGWAEQMAKKGFVSQSQLIADQLNQKQAEINLKNVRTKLKVLEDFTKDKELNELQANIERARAEQLAALREVALAESQEKALERRLKEVALLPIEDRALTSLDEALQLLDRRQANPDDAALADSLQAKLDEAAGYWKTAESRRAEALFAERKARIHATVRERLKPKDQAPR
jgi:hypothetical protein